MRKILLRGDLLIPFFPRAPARPPLPSLASPSFSANRLDPKTLDAASAVGDRIFQEFVVSMGGGCKNAFKDDSSAMNLLSTWIAGELYMQVSCMRPPWTCAHAIT